MRFEDRKRYYGQVRDQPLLPDDPRNLDLDSLPPPNPRGISWAGRLATRIELSDVPTVQLVTGLPGSGKSTELLRLAKRLEDRRRSHLLVVIVDAEEGIDLTQPVDVPDILALTVQKAEEAVLRAEGEKPEALQESYLTRLWQWLKNTDVTLTKAEYAIPEGAKLTAELKTRPSLRQQFREVLARHLTDFLRGVREELQSLDARARQCDFAGLAIIIDSLEKLRGISTNWDDVLQSAERVFGAGAPYMQLPVHVIYTVPAALVGRQVNHVEFLPMLKLRDRAGVSSEPGIRAMREIIRRRIDDDGLAELLGPDAEARVQQLIQQSGGYPREILLSLRWLLELPEHPATDSDLRRLVNESRDRCQAVITAEDLDWLATVGRSRSLMFENEAQRGRAETALRNNLVLRYANEDCWYDLHPAVRAVPAVRDRLNPEPEA